MQWGNVWDALRKRGPTGLLGTALWRLLPGGERESSSPLGRVPESETRPLILERAPEPGTPSPSLMPGGLQRSGTSVAQPDIKVEVQSKPQIIVKFGTQELYGLIQEVLIRENARARRGAGDNAAGFGVP
jgi:hypothetical protein